MSLLFDTHVFLWWIDGKPIPAPVSAAIRNPLNAVWLSAASVWEIAIKASIGKLRLPGQAVDFVEEQRQRNRLSWLPIEPVALEQLESLPFLHRDPFDRLLIAQALAHDYELASSDGVFAQYPVKLCWQPPR